LVISRGEGSARPSSLGIEEGFRRLAVYTTAVELADEIHACVRSWNGFDKWTVGAQLVRAADSVGANIAEAFGRNSHADERRLLVIARGSALELQHWLDRSRARDLPHPPNATPRANEIGRMLNGLLKSLPVRTND
jgi:four helix bundle protein